MQNILIDDLPLHSGHSVRGMGMYTKNLISSVLSSNHPALQIQSGNTEKLTQPVDLIHYPYFNLFETTLPNSKLADKVVVTVPDLIPLLFPKLYPLGIRGKMKLAKNIKLLKEQADAIITISETSKKDISRLCNINQDKIFVTYLAPNFVFEKISETKASKLIDKYNLPDKFVLYVGDVNVNKNIDTLLRASKKANVDIVLVGKQAHELDDSIKLSKGPRDMLRQLLGKKHPEVEHFNRLKKLFENKRVHRVGFLSNEELNAVWNLATVYVQPSLYEGFGLPVLEAMQAGVPVIASKTQALVEVAGDAAIFFKPKDTDNLALKIKKMFTSKKLRKTYINKGKKRVERFSWEKQAKEVIDVYKHILSG